MTKVYGVKNAKGDVPFHIMLETGGLSTEEHQYLEAKLRAILVDFQYHFPRMKEIYKEEYTE